MASNKISTRLKTAFGATGSELLAVFFILAGLIGGWAIERFGLSKGLEEKQSSQLIYSQLDSLMAAEKTSYVGTNYEGDPMPELASGDTVVEKEQFFGSPAGSKGKQPPAEPINLNAASRVQLMKLPGVGEKTAESIIAARPFRSVNELLDIKGIGPKKFAKMKDFVKVK
ncbi:MAG: ComEA family DNA-binding protein [Chloroflexota bacterium]